MKKILILCIGLFLSGCSNIESYSLRKAEDLCKPHGGIHSIMVSIGPDVIVTCEDGFIKDVKT